jgi:hypothetical protein
MTKTIQATINADRALSKISNYFDFTVEQILTELFQNARRAGATKLDIYLDRNTLHLKDNGWGIPDPQMLVNLFGSGWDEDTEQREDPAGAGFYSLANRGCMVSSHNWYANLTPAGFIGQEKIKIHEIKFQAGTHISFQVTEKELINYVFIENRVKTEAEYYPVEVTYNGETVKREVFIPERMYTENWNGLRIGVEPINKENHYLNINFYGQTVICDAEPKVYGRVRIDVVDCTQLRMVLPARKDVIQNDFFHKLQIEVEKVAFRAHLAAGSHELPFSAYQRAHALGINLPEAKIVWAKWEATKASDNHYYWKTEPGSLPENAYRFQSVGNALQDQLVDIATHELEFIHIKNKNLGYKWADSVPVLDVRFQVTHEGKLYFQEEIDTLSGDFVDDIQILFFHKGVFIKSCPIPILMYESIEESDIEADSQSYFDSSMLSTLLINNSLREGFDVDNLVYFLQASLFAANDDSDDSAETMEYQFEEDCQKFAFDLLLPEDKAIEAKIRNALFDMRTLIPKGYEVKITIKTEKDSKHSWMTDHLIDIQVSSSPES